MSGLVSLVGAGPGDASLLTRAAVRGCAGRTSCSTTRW